MTELRTLKLRLSITFVEPMRSGDQPLQLRRLNLGLNDLNEISVQALVQADCCTLSHLDLCTRAEGRNFVQHGTLLSQGQWPHLTWLVLPGNIGLPALASASWPALQSLELSGPTAAHDLVAFLQSFSHRLQTLVVPFLHIDKHTTAAPLAQDWPPNTRLGLTIVADIQALQSFSKHSWPAWSVTVLKGSCAASTMATELSKHQSTVLERLIMVNPGMGATGDLPWDLAHGKWPSLKHTDFSKNFLTDEFAHALSQADWPALEVMDLRSNSFDRPGKRQLAQAWPLLEKLKSRNNNFNQGIWQKKWVSIVIY